MNKSFRLYLSVKLAVQEQLSPGNARSCQIRTHRVSTRRSQLGKLQLIERTNERTCQTNELVKQTNS